MNKYFPKMNVPRRLVRHLVFFLLSSAFLFAGCVTEPLKLDVVLSPEIKFVRAYQELPAGKWQKTGMEVRKGETVLIVPLYPKGFINSVQGRIGETGKPFEGLDVDIGDIYTTQTDGILYFGMDKETTPVHTGIFVFKTDSFNNILSDLKFIQQRNQDVRMINVTLALLLKRQADRLIAQHKQAEALPVLDQSIGYLEKADQKLYSNTLYQLYREKAVIYYKNSQDMANYDDSVTKAYAALMRVAEYYSQLKSRRFAFLKQLTPEEQFILLTMTHYFGDVASYKLSEKNAFEFWGNMTLDNLAYAYRLLNVYYSKNGNLQLSLKYGEKALEEAKKVGQSDLIGVVYYNLCTRYATFGFYEEAEKYCQIAVDTMTKNVGMYGWPLITLATVKATQGQIDEAEELLRKVSFAGRGRNAAKDAVRSYLYSLKNQHREAIELGNKLLGFRSYVYSSSADPLLISLCRALNSYAEAGTSDEATRMFGMINDEIERQGNVANLRLLYALALSKYDKRMGRDEIVPLQDAIASLETIRPTAATGKDYEYWESMLKVYDVTIDSLYSKEKYTDALNTVEKARSRKFLDDLGNKKLGSKGSSSLMLQQANETLDTLAILEKDMLDAAQEAGIKLRAVYDKDSRLGKKLENYKATLKEVSDTDQQFGVVTNIVPISVEKLQQYIPNDTTVIEYYQSQDNLYAWVMDNRSITAVKQSLPKEKLRKLIEQYRKALYLDTARRGVAVVEREKTDFAQLQQEAYKLLISPVEKMIKTKKVCFVPYGILNYLPFQSLHDGKQYLIEKYSLSYIPSLSVLEYLRKSQRKDNYKILALGNPDLNDPRMNLPAAEKEVDMIKKIFPQTAVYKREQATLPLVRKIAPSYDIIHFAAHGEFNADDPLSSCIYLAKGEGEDGRLQVRDIFDMNINADMVVTSACQTGLGKIGRGDEVLGLTRAFLYAGANSVFGSLWSISDEATSVFMKEFYTNIKTMDRTEALRQAQIRMIKSKQYSHPFYWAAFNITGAL